MLSIFDKISGEKVMIIDDEVDLCLLLKALFLRKGCSVFISHTFSDAFECIGSISPDVVVMDIDTLFWSDEAIVKRLLAEAPDIKLIVNDKKIVYECREQH